MKQKGFSLIELLIVVAIILIIAAIAIPNLLQSKKRANESAAVAELRNLNTSAATFMISCGAYAAAITQYGAGATTSCATMNLGNYPASPSTKGGFTFAYTIAGAVACPSDAAAGCAGTYDMEGEPIAYQSTGDKSYITDQTTQLWFKAAAAIAAADKLPANALK